MADSTLVRHIWRPDRDFWHSALALVETSRRDMRRLAYLPGMSDFTPDGLERMLTTSELADYLKVTRQVIYDLRHDGRGPRGVHVGKELRFQVSDIRAWIEQRSDPVTKDAVDAR